MPHVAVVHWSKACCGLLTLASSLHVLAVWAVKMLLLVLHTARAVLHA